MSTAHLSVVLLAALATGCASCLSLLRVSSVRSVADRVQVSQDLMVPLGLVLAAGSVGLLVGLAVPARGLAASAGLVAYFTAAIGAHLRVGDRQVGGAVFYLVLAVAALALGIAVEL